MWQWSLNWNEIRTDLVVGSCPIAPQHLDVIRESTHASAFLSLQSDECRQALAIDQWLLREYSEANNLVFLNTPMLDFNPDDQRRGLPDAVRALTSLLATGHKVYVHCTTGLKRSPLTILAYLHFVELVAPDEALEFLRQSRSDVDPDVSILEGCRNDLVEVLNPFIHVRAYYLSHQHPDADASRNWYQAESDVIRQAFLSPRSLPVQRLDPNRP